MKLISKVLSFLLASMLIVCLAVTPVRAAEYTFQATAGETAYFIMFSDENDFIEEAYIYEGSIPGMWLEISGDVTLGLAGTPTTAGTFTVYISATTSNRGGMGIVATVKVEPKEPSAGTPVITKNPTGEEVAEGGSATFIARADNVRQYSWRIALEDATIDCADLPGYLGGGVTVSGANSEKLVISNIPKSLNGSYVWCVFVGAEESVESAAAKITVTPAVPVITKHPTDEAVDEGGEAVFIAKADYAKTYQWQLVSPGGTTYDCVNAHLTFPGLEVTGANTERITLSNIPAELDGYRIYCSFTAVQTVSSNMAKLYVTAKPTEPPTEESTEAPTEPPTEVPTEAQTEPPTQAPTEAETTVPEKDKDDEYRETGGRSGNTALAIVAIVAAAVVAVAAIVAIVILKLRDPKYNK